MQLYNKLESNDYRTKPREIDQCGPIGVLEIGEEQMGMALLPGDVVLYEDKGFLDWQGVRKYKPRIMIRQLD